MLFSLTVRGDGRAVARVGKLSMSYHDQSHPQRFLAASDGYYPGGDGHVVRCCLDFTDANSFLCTV